MRLIDADALYKTIAKSLGENFSNSNTQVIFDRKEDEYGIIFYLSNILERCELMARIAIRDAPTIDAVPVVRCKDCEYYIEEERWCTRLGLCGAFDPNGYCSHAERREE